MTTNGFDMVTLTPVAPAGPGLRVHLQGESELSGGVGGWSTVDRPRRRAAAEWSGTPLWQLKVPLRLDGMDYRGGASLISVEPEVERLISWGTKQDATGEPVVLLADGPLKIPARNPAWVIQDVAWGKEWRRPDRHRIAQEITLTLLEHAVAEVLLGPAARARAAR